MGSTRNQPQALTIAAPDRVIWRQEFQALAGVSPDTMRRWLREEGKLPAPDVRLSHKKTGWRVSTLRNAGICLV